MGGNCGRVCATTSCKTMRSLLAQVAISVLWETRNLMVIQTCLPKAYNYTHPTSGLLRPSEALRLNTCIFGANTSSLGGNMGCMTQLNTRCRKPGGRPLQQHQMKHISATHGRRPVPGAADDEGRANLNLPRPGNRVRLRRSRAPRFKRCMTMSDGLPTTTSNIPPPTKNKKKRKATSRPSSPCLLLRRVEMPTAAVAIGRALVPWGSF